MWTLVYAYIVFGDLVMEQRRFAFETEAECEYYATEILSDEIESDDGFYNWVCA
jgi:hypothetical protein